MATTKTKVNEANTVTDTVEERRAAHEWERVPYYVHKPSGLAKSETHFVVTLNGKNYRYAYNTQLMIPRCIAEILDNQKEMQDKADARAEELLANAGGGVNLGTY